MSAGRCLVLSATAACAALAAAACGSAGLPSTAIDDAGAGAADAGADATSSADTGAEQDAPASADSGAGADALVGVDAAAFLRPLREVPGSPPDPYLVRADADGIFVAAPVESDAGVSSGDEIVRLSPDGSAPPLELTRAADGIFDIALDDAFVYCALHQGIQKVPKTGGPPTWLVTGEDVDAIARLRG